MRLSTAAQILQATLKGNDLPFHGVSIDSRTLKAGELFLAIVGERFDGHDYIEQARQAGAVGAIVSAPVPTTLPTIQVKDTQAALWDLAKAYRATLGMPFIAVTGSCGKTTTKMLIAEILSEVGRVHANPGNYNNEIGVPLTILQTPPNCECVVTELGANHLGEIARLTELVQPQVAIITLAAAVHVEGFGSLKGVSRGKGEIFSGLTSDGTAIINADDPFSEYWRSLVSNHSCITFGISQTADVMAADIRMNAKSQPTFQINTPEGDIEVTLQLMGEHNVMNALAATSAVLAVLGKGASLSAIQCGLEKAMPVTKRLVERAGMRGETIIDDCYNANPAAAKAAIKILIQRKGKRVLVLGDMAELGDDAVRFHAEIGQDALALGVDQLYCLGELSFHSAKAFGSQGFHFTSHDALVQALSPHLNNEVTVLIKGSRSMQMEKITEALVG